MREKPFLTHTPVRGEGAHPEALVLSFEGLEGKPAPTTAPVNVFAMIAWFAKGGRAWRLRQEVRRPSRGASG